MRKLTAAQLKKLTGQQWYHQRFDGSPLFMSFIAFAEVRKEARKPAGTEADIRVCFYNDGKADWYLNMKDVRRGSRILMEMAKTDPDVSQKLLAKWKKDEDLFDQFFKDFGKIKLSTLKDRELLKLHNKYSRLALNRFTSSAIIDHFALGTDETIEKMLRQEVGKLNKESEFTDIFSVATAPVHQSFINQAEIDLLQIAINYPRNKKKIQKYQEKYYWSKNNYILAQNLSVDYFSREITNWLNSKRDLRITLRQLKNTPQRNKELKKKLFSKYYFSPLLKTLLKISEDFTWWQDERKRATYLNIDMGTKILSEMARRIGYDEDSVKFLLIPEVTNWFRKQSITEKELRARMKKSVMIIGDKRYNMITGQEVDKIKRIMMGRIKRDNIQDIRGLTASTGQAIGPVKVIGSAQEIGKVEVGDILVAVMTRPDYIAGMKKAAAIVTNEGGITCHAAIVSRELGIPCIIGTKIATEVFHDGDMVEVNANHGWVRKINKS